MKRRANNEGSIYRRKSDGRWVMHFPMPGRPKPIIAYCKTEQEAVEKLHELITAYSHVLERMKAASAERVDGIIGSVLPTNTDQPTDNNNPEI